MLRTVKAASIQERGEVWLNRLRSCNAQQLKAEQLYSGDHWSVVRSLAAVAHASGLRAKIWISSAGYGLISPGAPINHARVGVRSCNDTWGADKEGDVMEGPLRLEFPGAVYHLSPMQ
jgi:hypothetical protein